MNVEGLPPLATIWTAGAVILSLLHKFDFITENQLSFSPRLILQKQQYWRLLTTFMYFGPFNIHLFIKLLYTMRFTFMLEAEAYNSTRRAEYVWLVLVSSVSILLLAPLFPMRFLSDPLGFFLMYIWSRRNRHIRVSIFGLLVFNAPYLPFVELGATLLHDRSEMIPLLIGIVLGHICSYEPDILTRRRIRIRTVAP